MKKKTFVPTAEYCGCLVCMKKGNVVEFRNSKNETVKAGEKELGIVTFPITRALYSYGRELTKATEIRVAELHGAHGKGPCNHSQSEKREMATLQIQIKVVMDLFWYNLRMEFPDGLDEGTTLGIRKGWKVVTFKTEPEPDMRLVLLGGIPISGLLES